MCKIHFIRSTKMKIYCISFQIDIFFVNTQQALSSYVFIAANVILHAKKIAQQTHLRELLPPIIPLLTSHHHSLRGFTQVGLIDDISVLLIDVGLKFYTKLIPFSFGVRQLLVHRVLFRLFPPVESTSSQTKSLEELSFENLKSYLDKNPDCSRCVVLIIRIFHIVHRNGQYFCGQSHLEGFGLLQNNNCESFSPGL